MKIEPQSEPSEYFRNEYDTKGRFCSYWHQSNEIISLKPQEVLEIGIGNGFVSKYLKDRKVNLATLDIDERLNPDFVGSVLNLPFADNSFEVIACYEVLEHLPYQDFPQALREIHRVSKRYAILSLPDLSKVYCFHIQLPKVGELKLLIPQPRLRPLVYKFNGEHYWNIGTRGYPLLKIRNEICKASFKIDGNYRVFEMPWHRLFMLRKV